MRAQPARSEERRPAAQLVAYGGGRAGSMREGAHPGRIAPIPGTTPVSRGHAGPDSPSRDMAPRRPDAPTDYRRGSRSSKSPEAYEPEATRRAAGRHREPPGQPGLVGPERGRVPERARHVPRRRPLRLGSRGPRRGGGRTARPAGRPRRARTSWRSARARPSAPAGWPPRAPVRWPWTSPTASSSTPCGSASRCDPGAAGGGRRSALPFADGSFDLACSAYGALPFVADPVQVLREVRRVLRPGGRLVFSVTHPIRWAFPDEPGPEGLSVAASYFDRTPYVEQDERRQRGLRRAPPHARRPGARRGGRRLPAGRPGRAASGRPGTPRSGAAGPRCAAT